MCPEATAWNVAGQEQWAKHGQGVGALGRHIEVPGEGRIAWQGQGGAGHLAPRASRLAAHTVTGDAPITGGGGSNQDAHCAV